MWPRSPRGMAIGGGGVCEGDAMRDDDERNFVFLQLLWWGLTLQTLIDFGDLVCDCYFSRELESFFIHFWLLKCGRLDETTRRRMV